MDAIEYLKQKARMTNKCKINCSDCPLTHARSGYDCDEIEENYPQKAVEIVEQWAKEHPVKTRMSEFLKMFPDVLLKNDGMPIQNPCNFSANVYNECHNNSEAVCADCRKKFWLKEIDQDSSF